jgi:alcohol dehydrogenase class IV
MAGTIGALFDIPHGVVCGTLMSGANDMNVTELRKSKNGEAALRKYATLGRLFSDTDIKSVSYYVDFFLDYLRAITYLLELPGLGSYGLTGDDLPAITAQSDVKNNPVSLSAEQLEEILARRL